MRPQQTSPFKLLLEVKRHRQRSPFKLAVRPAGFKTSLPPRQARSAALWWGLTRGFRHRRGGGSRRFKRKQTVDASRIDLWLMSSSDKMGGGGDTASKDRTGIGEE